MDAAFLGHAPQVLIQPDEAAKYHPHCSCSSDIPIGAPGCLCVNASEINKYVQMWDHPEYRTVAPGEHCADLFLSIARPPADSTIIDFGAGTGRGALKLAQTGLRVRMLDFAPNCLDDAVRLAMPAHALRFESHDLTDPIAQPAEYGYCTDVMEHIPSDQVNRVLTNVLLGARHVFFQIACTEDHCGKLIGETLHLSVHPYWWWLHKLQELDCTVHWSQDFQTHCCFYVTAWPDAQAVVDAGVLNLGEAAVIENVRRNLDAPWQQVIPHETNEQEVIILGGGPSMLGELETIRKLKAEGAKIVTLNGAYHFARHHDLLPVTEIIVDARAFNARFTHPVEPGCKYLIASQCDPSVLEGLPQGATYLWHTSADFIRPVLDEKLPYWFGVPGGSTVLLRAIPLLRMLGFHQFHLFGCDSCVSNGHHAYPQPENDAEALVPVSCGGRMFTCQPWMVGQAQEFMSLIAVLGSEFELAIYGDGLLRHILETGASLSVGEA